MIKIAIANQSHNIIDNLMRHLLHKPGFSLIWVTDSCKDALQKCQENPPDLLILDINLPKWGGVEMTRQIREKYKCIILLTSTDIGQNAPKIFEAMGLGAVDVVSLKHYNFDEDKQLMDNLLKKIDTICILLGEPPIKRKTSVAIPKKVVDSQNILFPPLVVIGASTGGPVALSHVISTFPTQANFAVVIVQHIDELFIPSLISWLNDFSDMPVEVAIPGVKPVPGIIYVAAKNKHLIINSYKKFEYVNLEEDVIYAPSIDVFFESLEKNWKEPATAILLTGMGSDGAKGLKKLYDKKWFTIVQDQSSCIVFGMPKMAISLGAASEILSLDEIGPRIVNHLGYR